MKIKPFDKIKIREIVDGCGLNRQTFYYHFDDVYDLLEWVFEEDAKRVLPEKVVYETWQIDVLTFFKYLYDNRLFALNVFHSNSRLYMLRFIRSRLESCIRSFAIIVTDGMNIDRQDFEFVIEFYANGIVGLISQWLDYGMNLESYMTKERFIRLLEGSVENMLGRFKAADDQQM